MCKPILISFQDNTAAFIASLTLVSSFPWYQGHKFNNGVFKRKSLLPFPQKQKDIEILGFAEKLFHQSYRSRLVCVPRLVPRLIARLVLRLVPRIVARIAPMLVPKLYQGLYQGSVQKSNFFGQLDKELCCSSNFWKTWNI